MALIEYNELQVHLVEDGVSSFDDAVASDKEDGSISLLCLLENFWELLLVIDDEDVTARIWEIFFVFVGPMLHESVRANDQTVKVVFFDAYFFGFQRLIFDYCQNLQSLAQTHIITESTAEVVPRKEPKPSDTFLLVGPEMDIFVELNFDGIVEVRGVLEVFDEFNSFVRNCLQFWAEVELGDVCVDSYNETRETVHGDLMQFDLGDGPDDFKDEDGGDGSHL
jgi:hypothetical protein